MRSTDCTVSAAAYTVGREISYASLRAVFEPCSCCRATAAAARCGCSGKSSGRCDGIRSLACSCGCPSLEHLESSHSTLGWLALQQKHAVRFSNLYHLHAPIQMSHEMRILLTVLAVLSILGCQTSSVRSTSPDTSNNPSGSSVRTARPAVTITKPGMVAIDALARRRQLTDADALDMCPRYAGEGTILHDVAGPDGYGLDERYSRVGVHFRRLGASCLGGIGPACVAIQDDAMNWARHSRLGGPAGKSSDSSRYWNDTLSINMRLLSPMIAALGVAEQFSPIAPEDRKILDPWLKSKIDAFEHGMRNEGRYKGGRHGTTARKAAHNHAVQSSIAAMSYGAWIDDPEYFKTGLEQWPVTLGSMRKDGSLPIETRRGARALFYHGRTLGALIQLAERAAVQGINLYDSAPHPDKTIHHAVEFFINAIEQPDLVLNYARTNKAPGPSKNYKIQDLGGRGSTMGWVAPYMNRFPDHPNTRRLTARVKLDHSEPQSYLTVSLDEAVRRNGESAEWIGVDARCFYANPALG